MSKTNQLPIYELTRGGIVESVHYGSVAVSDNQGHLVAWYGDPNTFTFLRSSAKPFQALPFIETNGAERYGLSTVDIALVCSSHSGTDQHYERITALQVKTGVKEEMLQCGVHPPTDGETAFEMRKRNEPLTPNRHNCSGKHTGMLAFALMEGWSTDNYLDPAHPIQELILTDFSEMTGIAADSVGTGIDGCSAPNFAIPLINTALAYARLCDPRDFPETRKAACKKITTAMTQQASMVAGPDRFDTRLMETCGGKIISKAGAEGYQAIGIMPGALEPGSPALGVAIKITDGDLNNRARPAVTLEVLNQLNALSNQELSDLEIYGPVRSLENFQDIEIGISRPTFKLNFI